MNPVVGETRPTQDEDSPTIIGNERDIFFDRQLRSKTTFSPGPEDRFVRMRRFTNTSQGRRSATYAVRANHHPPRFLISRGFQRMLVSL